MTEPQRLINAADIHSAYPLVPGDNPNKRNMKRSTKNRPKSKNVPRTIPEECKLRWVDPLPEEVNVPVTDFDQRPESDRLAEFSIHEKFATSTIQQALPIIENVLEKSTPTLALIPYLEPTLTGLTYISNAVRLYTTTKKDETLHIKKISQLTKITVELPLPIVQATSILGSFDSIIGRFHLKWSPIIAMKMLSRAIRAIRKCPQHPLFNRMPNVPKAKESFYPINDSIEWIHSIANANIANALERPVTVQVNNVDIEVRAPKQGDRTLAQYHGILNDDIDPDSVIRNNIVVLQSSSLAELQAGTVLADIGYQAAPSIDDLINACVQIQIYYNQKFYPKVKASFRLAMISGSKNGAAAQLAVDTGQMSTTTPFPIPDSDMALGAILKPGLECKFVNGWSQLAPSQSATLLATLTNAATRHEF